jgi:hypothetical protein
MLQPVAVAYSRTKTRRQPLANLRVKSLRSFLNFRA